VSQKVKERVEISIFGRKVCFHHLSRRGIVRVLKRGKEENVVQKGIKKKGGNTYSGELKESGVYPSPSRGGGFPLLGGKG